jgi:acyl-CoA synthetase (AMP-forming)/AMP-acid ligase II
LHCVKVSEAKFFVFGIEVADKVADLAHILKQAGMRLLCHGGEVNFAERLDTQLAKCSKERPPRVKVTPFDCWGFIYTSGTTGLPKAALIRNSKFWGSAAFFSSQFEVTEKDVIYNCLPLYHSAGGMICVAMSFFTGATMVIKRKFSATAFWEDVRRHKCTVFQYIGELCRYLMTVPPSPLDKKTSIRIAIGNGLRPDIWEEFQTRFAIPEIGEFYSSTEGLAAFITIIFFY